MPAASRAGDSAAVGGDGKRARRPSCRRRASPRRRSRRWSRSRPASAASRSPGCAARRLRARRSGRDSECSGRRILADLAGAEGDDGAADEPRRSRRRCASPSAARPWPRAGRARRACRGCAAPGASAPSCAGRRRRGRGPTSVTRQAGLARPSAAIMPAGPVPATTIRAVAWLSNSDRSRLRSLKPQTIVHAWTG